MTNNSTKTPMTYRDEVMTWGNLSPWKRLRIRVSHKDAFHPSQVVRDGQGNILSRPLQRRKPCFGRPEAFFRHGKRTLRRKLPNGQIVDWTKHQCGSCPAGVWQACAETAWERVQSDARICQAFGDWLNYCKANHFGRFTYTGPASRLWGAFKEAIAARGPFSDSNDAELAKLAAVKAEDERRKWVRQKRRQREQHREASRSAQQLPSIQFVINLQDARNDREADLLEVLGRSDQPPSRSKVTAEKRDATATITANAWAVRKLLHASGMDARPGTIARKMVDHDLSAGCSYGTLKARIANDLRRADECERDGLWPPFDPDADLEDWEAGDDWSADSLLESESDLDRILRELNPDNYLVDEADDPLPAPPTNAVHACSQ